MLPMKLKKFSRFSLKSAMMQGIEDAVNDAVEMSFLAVDTGFIEWLPGSVVVDAEQAYEVAS